MVNIVLRIRTNLGVKRLTIDENASISLLAEEVTRLFNIISAIPLVLSLDLEGGRLLNADLSISGQNIPNVAKFLYWDDSKICVWKKQLSTNSMK